MEQPVKPDPPQTRDIVVQCLCGRSKLVIKEAELLRPDAITACIDPFKFIMQFCRGMFCGCNGEIINI